MLAPETPTHARRINAVLVPPRSILVSQELFNPDERDENTGALDFDTVWPRFIESDARDGCEDINAQWRNANLKNRVLVKEIRKPQLVHRRSKCR